MATACRLVVTVHVQKKKLVTINFHIHSVGMEDPPWTWPPGPWTICPHHEPPYLWPLPSLDHKSPDPVTPNHEPPNPIDRTWRRLGHHVFTTDHPRWPDHRKVRSASWPVPLNHEPLDLPPDHGPLTPSHGPPDSWPAPPSPWTTSHTLLTKEPSDEFYWTVDHLTWLSSNWEWEWDACENITSPLTTYVRSD